MVYTKKGNNTKNQILDCAREVFSEEGYSKAGISAISVRSGIALGNITYYFKKKDDLVRELYTDCLLRIKRAAAEVFGEANAYEQYFLSMYTFYRLINSCPENARFYYEVIRRDSNRRILFEYLFGEYEQMNSCLVCPLPEKNIRQIVLAEIGIHHEILLSYFEGRAESDFDELILFMIKTTCRFFELSPEQTDRIIDRVLLDYGQFDTSGFRLL